MEFFTRMFATALGRSNVAANLGTRLEQINEERASIANELRGLHMHSSDDRQDLLALNEQSMKLDQEAHALSLEFKNLESSFNQDFSSAQFRRWQ